MVQIRPDPVVANLEQDFQKRYEPNFAWKSAVSSFLALPVLRAFWSMASVAFASAAPPCLDVSANANHLSNINSCDFGFDSLAPYVTMTAASSQHLLKTDIGAANWADIRGNETYVVSGDQGFCFAFWCYPTSSVGGGGQQVFASKWSDVLANYTWLIDRNGNNNPRFVVSTVAAPATPVTVSSSTTVTVDAWNFIAVTFIPSTSINIYVNSTTPDTTAVGVPATLPDSTAPVILGAKDLSAYYDGRLSMVAMCASRCSGSIIGALYNQTRAMYGV